MYTRFWSHLSKLMHLFFILYLLFEDVDFLFFFYSPPLTQYFLECGSFVKETKNSSVCKHYSLLVDELWSRKRYYYLVHINSEYCRKWNADILFNFELTHQVDEVGDNCWNWRVKSIGLFVFVLWLLSATNILLYLDQDMLCHPSCFVVFGRSTHSSEVMGNRWDLCF